jgi:hypothetical protein
MCGLFATAVEKLVALTRRIAAIKRGYYNDDQTLIRHLYDLSTINLSNKIGNDFFRLAKIVVNNDAKQFKNQHPEYSLDPCSEIQYSVKILKNEQVWRDRYEKFIEEMVYDNTNTFDYVNSLREVEEITNRVINFLKN